MVNRPKVKRYPKREPMEEPINGADMKKKAVARKHPKEWGDKPFVPKGFKVMKRVDSREVKVLKALKRQVRAEGKGYMCTQCMEHCLNLIADKIKKESKVKHYAKG